MGRETKMHANLSLSSLVILLLILSSCKSAKFGKESASSKYIDYYVFDELENYLCKRIAVEDSSGQNKVVGILIQPEWSRCRPELRKSELTENIFSVSILFESAAKKYKMPSFSNKYDSLIRKSNRRMRICNNSYPVLIVGIDEIFSDTVWKNAPYPHDRRPTPTYLYSQRGVYADMTNKKIIYSFWDDRKGYGE